ncbi:MAG: glycosyltransferase family 2 protein, partial [Balneolaceae bacterium]
MADQQLVSVIIPTKNRRDLLERALRSVLQQTWKNLEIVVVDDASNDSTGEYLHSLSQNSLLQIIRNRNSKGASTSRNIALKHAKGE